MAESSSPSFRLDQEYVIDTPENVTFAYDVAGIGNRFIAALIDTLILALALVLINVILLVFLDFTGDLTMNILFGDDPPSWWGGLVLALYFLLNFALFWGYYILFESLWNGQTPGKRLVKIRVLRTDGNPVGFTEVVLRNLVRPIDFLPTGYGLGLLVMFFNQQTRRLGDFAAGTVVVRERADLSLDTLAPDASADSPENAVAAENNEALLLAFPAIRRLSASDYELIQEGLERESKGTAPSSIIQRLAAVTAARLEETPPATTDESVRFLRRVAAAYRHLHTVGEPDAGHAGRTDEM